MFPGLGVYSPDGGTLETVSDLSSGVISDLRQGMRLVLLEEDNQLGPVAGGDYADATLVYSPTLDQPPAYLDEKSYNGLEADEITPCADPNNCADGLPDVVSAGNDPLPANDLAIWPSGSAISTVTVSVAGPIAAVLVPVGVTVTA